MSEDPSRARAANVVLALALALAGACGGPPPPGQRPDPRENEVTALWTQIRDWRKEAHMPLDPTAQDVFQLAKRSVRDARLSCPEHHPVPTSCNDVCNLADDICDNAERICQIADELGKGDVYSQDKCASAKASCREAKQQCCSCSEAPKQPPAAAGAP